MRDVWSDARNNARVSSRSPRQSEFIGEPRAGRWDLSSAVKALLFCPAAVNVLQQLYGSLSDRKVDGKIAVKERNLRHGRKW